ncbi:unnamed protein product [Calicophoron daubneyi]|uniref:RING-type domain-containing protein n=1 Tax=Calicophoron daubneyi TaxID=300641 RepID=A0AAV2TRM7_CALDB
MGHAQAKLGPYVDTLLKERLCATGINPDNVDHHDYVNAKLKAESLIILYMRSTHVPSGFKTARKHSISESMVTEADMTQIRFFIEYSLRGIYQKHQNKNKSSTSTQNPVRKRRRNSASPSVQSSVVPSTRILDSYRCELDPPIEENRSPEQRMSLKRASSLESVLRPVSIRASINLTTRNSTTSETDLRKEMLKSVTTALEEYAVFGIFEESQTGKIPECVICLENFEAGDITITLPCFHIFHQQCAASWFSKHMECPICQINPRQTEVPLMA